MYYEIKHAQVFMYLYTYECTLAHTAVFKTYWLSCCFIIQKGVCITQIM